MDARAGRRAQVLGLIVLSAIGAELLAAYGDLTGDPAGVAFSLVFFGALYGAPALVARELARRLGWGWPSLLLIFAALGVAQACLIDQSMFSADYEDYEGWEETRAATLVPALGLSAHNAVNFVVGHMIYSYGAPVAVAEAWIPARARQPWLRWFGTLVASLVYVGAAALVLSDPGSRSASTAQAIGSVCVVVALVAAAVVLGRRHAGSGRPPAPAPAGRPAPSVRAVLVASMACALVATLGPETWWGLVVGVTVLAAGGLTLARFARRPGWSIRHSAAVGLGFLLVRGVLAFTYYPLAGEVAPPAKYAHNVVMLALVGWAGWMALRPRPTQEVGDRRAQTISGT